MIKNYTKTSKFLSLVLRHKPEKIGLTLMDGGWASVDQLLSGMNMTREDLEYIVETDEKQRYSFNENKTLIRANQGHSVDVNMHFIPKQPPEFLYHGTGEKNLGSILAEGITKQSRQYVHLSSDVDIAIKVGERHGNPVVLLVHSGDMYRDLYEFYLSENGVWLTDSVPNKYIVQYR